jgi:hypothetical protein
MSGMTNKIDATISAGAAMFSDPVCVFNEHSACRGFWQKRNSL